MNFLPQTYPQFLFLLTTKLVVLNSRKDWCHPSCPGDLWQVGWGLHRESGMSSENHKNSVLFRILTGWRGMNDLFFFRFGMGFPVFEGPSILQKISFWCLLFGCLEKSSSLMFEFLQQLAKPKARDRVLKSNDSQEVFLGFQPCWEREQEWNVETLEVRKNHIFFWYFMYLEVGIHQLEDGQSNIKSLHFWEIKFACLKGYPGFLKRHEKNPASLWTFPCVRSWKNGWRVRMAKRRKMTTWANLHVKQWTR